MSIRYTSMVYRTLGLSDPRSNGLSVYPWTYQEWTSSLKYLLKRAVTHTAVWEVLRKKCYVIVNVSIYRAYTSIDSYRTSVDLTLLSLSS